LTFNSFNFVFLFLPIVEAWGLALFAVPLLVTEVLGYRRDKEFVELYPAWSWPTQLLTYVAIFYAIVWFGARRYNEFIYFQF